MHREMASRKQQDDQNKDSPLDRPNQVPKEHGQKNQVSSSNHRQYSNIADIEADISMVEETPLSMEVDNSLHNISHIQIHEGAVNKQIDPMPPDPQNQRNRMDDMNVDAEKVQDPDIANQDIKEIDAMQS